jgi:hypothetical protein
MPNHADDISTTPQPSQATASTAPESDESSLGASVDALLKEMSEQCERLESKMAAAPTDPTDPTDPATLAEEAAAAQPLLDDLAASVDDMVRGVASVTNRVGHAATDPAAPPSTAQEPADPLGELADELLAGLDAQTPNAPAEPTPQTEASLPEPAAPAIEQSEAAANATPDLLGAIPDEDHVTLDETKERQPATQTLEPAIAQTAEPVEPAKPTEPEAGVIEPVTAALTQDPVPAATGVAETNEDPRTHLTDEVLTVLGEEPTETAKEAPVADASTEPADADPAQAANSDPLASLTDELLSGLGEEHAEKPHSTAAPPTQPVVAPIASRVEADAAHTPSNSTPHATSTARRVLHAAGHAGLAAAKKAEPHALKAAAAVSAPLRDKPRAVKDTIGWLAIYTLFVGLTLLVYVKFIHEPPAPTPTHTPVRLADQSSRKGAAGEVVRHASERADEQTDPQTDPGAHAPKDEPKDAGGADANAKPAGPKPSAPKLPAPAIKPGKDAKPAEKDAKKGDKKVSSKSGSH